MGRSVFLLMLVIHFSAGGCKSYQADNFPDTYLSFGQGGGFTGMTTEYILLENGQLFKREARAGAGEYQELKSVDRSEARAMYKSWQQAEVFKEDFQHPGNLYHFISMKMADTTYRYTWGDQTYPADDRIKAFYQQLLSIVKVAQSPPPDQQR